MSLAAILTVLGLIVVAGIVALRILPRRRFAVPTAARVPAPVVAGLVAGTASLAFLALLFPIGDARQPAFAHGNWVLIPMLIAAVIAIAVARQLARWSASPDWTERHRLIVVGAALVGHSIFGLITRAKTLPDQLVMAAVIAVTVLVIVKLARRDTVKPAVVPDGLPAD
jgi:hypothetical protein